MNDPVIVEDIRPLIALLAPWAGIIGIIWAGEKRANLREMFTFIAASVQAAVVLSLVPIILSGAVVEFHIWQIFSHVPMLLRVMVLVYSLPVLLLCFGLLRPSMLWATCEVCMNMPKPDFIPSLPSLYPPRWGLLSRPTF